MMLKSSIILFVLASIVISEQITTEFQIRKRHPKWSTFVPLGKLTVKISQERRSIESEVEAYTSEFLTENDFDDENPIIMEFISIKSNSQEYQDKIYMTSIDEINREPHGQKIAIVTGFDPTHLSINAINYVQTRNRVGEIYTEVVRAKEEESTFFNYVKVDKKDNHVEEGFFSRYKWPIIIGGVVLFTMMSSGSEAGQAAAPSS